MTAESTPFQLLLGCDLKGIMTDERARSTWVDIWKKTLPQVQSSSGSHKGADGRTLQLIQNVSHNQLVVAEQMVELEEDIEREVKHLQEFVDQLQLESATSDSPSFRITKKEQLHDELGIHGTQEHLPSPPTSEEADNHLRDWYLLNITRPFPDKPAKERLTAHTGMDARQLNTWFTNMRRRSGYTELLRTFADGDKERFVQLCADAERGEGPQGFREALTTMKGYVGKKPKGKVGDWLLNIIEESNREEDTRPAKKARLESGDDPRLSQPEHTIAPPTSTEDDIAPIKPETHNSSPDESYADTNATPASHAKRTPIKPKSARPPPKKQIKMYTFDAGASDETPTKPSSGRRPTATSRPSPLRSVSDSSTDSVQVVDIALRSVSGSSTTASNVSGDLNFSFPAFQQMTPPQRPVLVRVPSSEVTQRQQPREVLQYQQPRSTPNTPYGQPPPVFPFGIPETSQFVFNPDLPHTVQLHFTSPHPIYAQPMLYPPIQLAAPAPPTYGYQQFTTFQQPAMQFSDNFGSMKRGFEAVGGVENERTTKMARFEGM